MFIAEREGFEPPEPLSSTVFKTAAIDHSAISPVVSNMFCNRFVLNCGAKVRIIFDCANFLKKNLSLEMNFSSFINGKSGKSSCNRVLLPDSLSH